MTPQKGPTRPWRVIARTWRGREYVYATYPTREAAVGAGRNIEKRTWGRLVRVEHRDNPGVPVEDGTS